MFIEDFQPVDAWKLNYLEVGKVNHGKQVCCQLKFAFSRLQKVPETGAKRGR